MLNHPTDLDIAIVIVETIVIIWWGILMLWPIFHLEDPKDGDE